MLTQVIKDVTIKLMTYQVNHSLAHCDIQWAHERSPFIQHLLGSVTPKVWARRSYDSSEGVVH